MAKRKRKRRLKKKFRILLNAIFIVGLIVFVAYMFQLGTSYLPFLGNDIPTNQQDPTPVAKGIDVSEWQENIDWQAVKDAGYQFVIVRTSFGTNGKVDASFYDHVEGAKDAGLEVGAYHYSHATNVSEALAEAQTFVSLLNYYRWEFPVYIDVEATEQETLDRHTLTDIVKTFCDYVSDEGYEAGIYASQYWLEHHLTMAELEKYEVWIASYTDDLHYTGDFGMWQYTKTGNVPGISGNVDIDLCYRQYPRLIKNARKNNY